MSSKDRFFEKSFFPVSQASHRLGLTSINLAYLGLETVCVIKRKQFDTEPGENVVRLRGQVRDGLFKKLRDDQELTIETITYCQRSLSKFCMAKLMATVKKGLKKLPEGSKREVMHEGLLADQPGSSTSSAENLPRDELDGDELDTAVAEKIRQEKDVINHDFLLIHVQPGDPQAQKICILAEKTGRNAKYAKAGVYVEYVSLDAEADVYHEGLHHYKIECNAKPFKGLESIIDLLTKDENPDYNLKDANCWHYARKTTKHLLEACSNVVSSGEHKERLINERKNLDATLETKHFINTAKRLRDRLANFGLKK